MLPVTADDALADLDVVVVPIDSRKRRTTIRSTTQSEPDLKCGRQVEDIMAATSDTSKDVMIGVLYLVVFFDIIGGTILMVSTPLLYNPAGTCPQLLQLMAALNRTSPVGAVPQESLDEGLGMYAADGRSVGVATALNMGSSLFKSFAVLAKLLAAPLAARLGKKYCLLLYTYGGALAYFLTYAAKPNIFNAPWSYFLAMRALSGFVGGSMTIVTMLISDLYSDQAKRQLRVGLMMLSFLAAVSVGPLVGNAMIGAKPGDPGVTRPFNPLLFACAGSFAAGLAVTFVVKVPPKLDKKPETDGAGQEEVTEGGKLDGGPRKGYHQWLFCVFAGRVLDSLGDGAMTYLVSVAFWRFALQRFFSLILVGLSGLAFIALPAAFLLKDTIGYAATCASAQTAAGAILALIPLAETQAEHLRPADLQDSLEASFLVLFFAAQCCTMFAQILRSNMVLDIVPRDVKDKWIAITDAVDDTAAALSPYMLVTVLDNERWGPYHAFGPGHDLQKECEGTPGSLLVMVGLSKIGIDPECGCMGGVGSDTFATGTYLIVNGCVNILSAIPYLLLLARFPVPCCQKLRVEPESVEQRLKALAAYRETGDPGMLPLKDLWAEWRQLREAGLEPLEQRFGRWTDDRPRMRELKAQSRKDWQWLCHEVLPQQLARFRKIATTEDKVEWFEEVAISRKNNEVSRDQKREIGEWFVDYLHWAGYGNPASMPRGWKDLLTTAFPPLHYENGVEHPKYPEDPVPHMIDASLFVNNLLQLDTRNQKFGRDFSQVGVDRAVLRGSVMY